ncbi:MAG: arylmalonate decarboxylase [Burkholderiales bacterium]|nr:arylmalonate decarboxylase [Burkholderiales bacterium]
MSDTLTIGLVVPVASDTVSPEGPKLYPGIRFVARGVGVKALTPQGYDGAWEGIVPAAEGLAAAGVDALMLMGTSLTFYRGYEAHAQLLETVRRLTGLPTSSMSEAVVEGLRALGAMRIGVATAYADVVNSRLRGFLTDSGFEVLALRGFGLEEFGAASRQSEEDIVALAADVAGSVPQAQGLLISCGGLRTLEVGKTIEERAGVPVVSSTPAAFWQAVRVAGGDAAVPGYGKLLSLA